MGSAQKKKNTEPKRIQAALNRDGMRYKKKKKAGIKRKIKVKSVNCILYLMFSINQPKDF